MLLPFVYCPICHESQPSGCLVQEGKGVHISLFFRIAFSDTTRVVAVNYEQALTWRVKYFSPQNMILLHEHDSRRWFLPQNMILQKSRKTLAPYKNETRKKKKMFTRNKEILFPPSEHTLKLYM